MTTFVLNIDRDGHHPLVSVHQTLDAAQDELRAYTKTIFGDDEIGDDEILERLLERRIDPCVHIIATEQGRQISTTTTPFPFAAKVA